MKKSTMSSPFNDIVTHPTQTRRTLFIGDVHGCSEELQHLLDSVQPTRVILLGDLFTKGSDPKGVWELIQIWNADAVMGNHDQHVLLASKRNPIPKKFKEIPKETINWLKSRPLYIEGDKWIAVHAGINPHSLQIEKDVALHVRRWPNDNNPQNPFWWQLYNGEKLIIYGHDAKRNLQDNRPKTLGLDSGCVYGGRLSGYLLEEDRIISVPSNKNYVAIINKELE
jgi:predicted phosphodiesterase